MQEVFKWKFCVDIGLWKALGRTRLKNIRNNISCSHGFKSSRQKHIFFTVSPVTEIGKVQDSSDLRVFHSPKLFHPFHSWITNTENYWKIYYGRKTCIWYMNLKSWYTNLKSVGGCNSRDSTVLYLTIVTTGRFHVHASNPCFPSIIFPGAGWHNLTISNDIIISKIANLHPE